jgi:type I restriction enzyme M protein
MAKENNNKSESFEKTLFKTADKLRKNMDAAEYRAENVFFVPSAARWTYLHSRAKQPSIGKDVDDAMEVIEKENPTLKGILPKVYARPNLDKAALGGLI